MMGLGPFAVTFATGLLVAFATLCVALHEILLSPDRPNYPTAPAHQRAAMFVWMCCLGYRGVEILSLLYAPTPTYVSPGSFWASAALALAQAVMLEQQLRRWLPARLHARIRRLLEIAACKRRPGMDAARQQSNSALRPGVPHNNTPSDVVGPALVALTLDGAQLVAAPGEIPQEWKPVDA